MRVYWRGIGRVLCVSIAISCEANRNDIMQEMPGYGIQQGMGHLPVGRAGTTEK